MMSKNGTIAVYVGVVMEEHETIASYLTLVKSEPLLIVLAPERHDWPPSACMWLVNVNDFQGSKYHAD